MYTYVFLHTIPTYTTIAYRTTMHMFFAFAHQKHIFYMTSNTTKAKLFTL